MTLPTPLYACPVHQDWTEICDAPPDRDRTIIGSTIGEDHAQNAAHLIRIVNAHASLRDALRGLLATAEMVDAGNKAKHPGECCGFAPELFAKCHAVLDGVPVPASDKITVGVSIYRGCFSGARASRPDIDVALYDWDSLEEEGDAAEAAASDEYEALPYPVY